MCAGLFIAGSGIFTSCEANALYGPGGYRADDPSCTRYFPASPESRDREVLDMHEACWFSRSLDQMHEPSLRSMAGDVEAYRFAAFPSWDGPFTVRVERRNGVAMLVATKLDRGEAPKPPIQWERRLTPAEWDALVQAIAQSPLWTQSNPPKRRLVFDGTAWILEGTREGRYRALLQWSPNDSSMFARACLKLFEMSGLPPPKHGL